MTKRSKQRASGAKQKASRASRSGKPSVAERTSGEQLGEATRGAKSAGDRFTWSDGGLLLLLIVWLHAFEAMLRSSGYAVVVAWLATSGALVATWLSARRRQGRTKRWAKVTASLVACAAAFSWVADAISDSKLAEWSSDEVLQMQSPEPHDTQGANQPPAGLKRLVCRSDLVVFGRPRSNVERYVGLVDDMIFSVPWEVLLERIPADFTEYATLVDPTLGELPANERPAALGRAFLQWQFPRQVLLIGLPDPNPLGSALWGCEYAKDLSTPGILVEDNRLGISGIYGVTPLFKALFDGELASRLRIYWSIVKYTFSPYDRRDLQQDPYFLLYRGEMTEFDRRVNELPHARREFLLKKRASMAP